MRPHIRQRFFDGRHAAQDLRAGERLSAPASALGMRVLYERLEAIHGIRESRLGGRVRLEVVPQLAEALLLISGEQTENPVSRLAFTLRLCSESIHVVRGDIAG